MPTLNCQAVGCQHVRKRHQDERWLPVVGFEGLYEVSNLGRVRSLDRTRVQALGTGPEPDKLVSRFFRGKLLALSTTVRGGYSCVTLSDAGKLTTRKVHQLVAEAFIGPRPEGQMPLHGDGNPKHNALGNLRYGTPLDNAADASGHGRVRRGEQKVEARMSNATAAAIKALLGKVSRVDLCDTFDVTISAIQNIVSGRCWASVPASEEAEAWRAYHGRAERQAQAEHAASIADGAR